MNLIHVKGFHRWNYDYDYAAYRPIDSPVATTETDTHMAMLGEALRAARAAAGLTQEGIAAAMSARGLVTDQSQVSRWEKGTWVPSFEQLAILEDCLHLPRGYVLARLGFITATDVEKAIAADSKLSDALRQELLDAYRTALRLSRRNARSPSRSARR